MVLPDGLQFIDLSHPLVSGAPVYPGDPPLSLTALSTIENDGYHLTQVQSVFHTGTHLDAPSHFIQSGQSIRNWPMNFCLGKAMVVPAPGSGRLNPSLLDQCIGWQYCDFLLFNTGWSKHYGTPEYFLNHPVFSEELGKCLAESSLKVVGMDLPSPDQEPYPIHHVWANSGKYILENLCNLDLIPAQSVFSLICIPLPIAAEASWVRPLAIISS